MTKTYTCVLCPNSCDITGEYEEGKILSISGNKCPKGNDYVTQELLDPRRTISTSVTVRGGNRPLASVRLTSPVPLREVMPLMEEIKKISLDAPVEPGQVLMEKVLGTEADLITTSRVDKVTI